MSGVIATPTKTPKRRAKHKQTGPSVSDLILKVVSASKSRTGVSLPALKKSLAVSGYDVVKNNSRVKLSVRRLVRSGALLQPRGTGASGSFKINAKKPAAKKKKVVRKKKVKRKKVKRVSPKKAAVAKKSPARKKKVKQSPKVKKPVAAKKPVKKSPKTKVAVRSVAMSTRAKDPAKK